MAKSDCSSYDNQKLSELCSGGISDAVVVHNSPSVTIYDKSSYDQDPEGAVIKKSDGFAVELFRTLQSVMNFSAAIYYPPSGTFCNGSASTWS